MDAQAIACHSKCISFLSFHPPQHFLKAMEFSFEPFLGAKIKRQNKICSVLQEALMNSQETTTRLPAEIWLQIAKLLVREYAVATTREAWLIRCSSDCCVDISASIWARFVLIDGVNYIANLANTPVIGHGDQQIFDANELLSTEILYVSEDHLGIRQTLFAAAKNSVSCAELNDMELMPIPLKAANTRRY